MRLRPLILVLAALAAFSPAAAQTVPAPGPAPAPAKTEITPPAELHVWNRPVILFRAHYGELSPADRAEAARARIQDLPDQALAGPVVAEKVTIGDAEGRMVFAGARPLFTVLPGDVNELSGETLDSLASTAVANVREILAARAEQRNTANLRTALIEGALATLALFVVLWLLQRLRRRIQPKMTTIEARVSKFNFLGFEVGPQVRLLLQRGVDVLLLGGVVATLYLWITFVFSLFPYTRPWSALFGRSLLSSLAVLGQGFLQALPGLGMVVLIFFVTRFANRIVGSIFRAAEVGTVSIPGIHPETATASRRIGSWLIWLFAVIVAYPYLPGSDTDVFKGVSVFTGILLSLGASGVVGQVMSGLVVVYARAVRVGEYVRVGEHEGTVTEIGMLSTKLLTIRREEITIPNTVLVGTTTTNFSRQEQDGGAVVRTTLTIGYDAPWRQVHAMLLGAADRTALIRKEPKAFVLQSALSDFYVEYTLVVRVDHAAQRFQMLSELHANIQDAFNQHGVQIMSPHFEGQPEGRVVVPPAKWYESPASPPPNPGRPT